MGRISCSAWLSGQLLSWVGSAGKEAKKLHTRCRRFHTKQNHKMQNIYDFQSLQKMVKKRARARSLQVHCCCWVQKFNLKSKLMKRKHRQKVKAAQSFGQQFWFRSFDFKWFSTNFISKVWETRHSKRLDHGYRMKFKICVKKREEYRRKIIPTFSSIWVRKFDRNLFIFPKT